MEKREFCIDFIKGECEKRGECRFAHVIVQDKEVYLKTYEVKKVSMSNMGRDKEIEEPKYALMEPKNGGKKRWMTKCLECSKGFYFDFEIERGTPESLYCTSSGCITKFYEKQAKMNFL